MSEAILVLADGTTFEGESFGAVGKSSGEVVFNTSMTGYQEILTDPSYRGELLTMTYPLIGNYGTNDEDYESLRPYLGGFIVKEYSEIPSNWRSGATLDTFLKKYNVVAIQGVDTRALTRHIRDKGAQQGIISSSGLDRDRLAAEAAALPSIVGKDLVKEVSTDKSYVRDEGSWQLGKGYKKNREDFRFNVVAYDFGIKFNILRSLYDAGCRVRVVPARTPWEEVLSMKPDGLFLSNGPGDPEPVDYAIDNVRNLLGKLPDAVQTTDEQRVFGGLGQGLLGRLDEFGGAGENYSVFGRLSQSAEGLFYGCACARRTVNRVCLRVKIRLRNVAPELSGGPQVEHGIEQLASLLSRIGLDGLVCIRDGLGQKPECRFLLLHGQFDGSLVGGMPWELCRRFGVPYVGVVP